MSRRGVDCAPTLATIRGVTTLRDEILAARTAGKALQNLSTSARRALLQGLADAYAGSENQRTILEANRADVAAGEAAAARGELGQALVKRLALDSKKIAALVDGLQQMAAAPELVGLRTVRRKLDENLVLERITCPLGVLGVVFEARPDALVQITGLAWKSGNAVVLKGGKEALGTNRELARIAKDVLQAHGIDPHALLHIEDRAGVADVLNQHDLVDLMIARGSSEFVHYVRANTQIPVMAHADGVCHVYLHTAANAKKAVHIVVDGKTSYPAACNTTECLLWDEGAALALDACVAALKANGVLLRGCPETVARHPDMQAATLSDWGKEYGDLVLAIRKVYGMNEALAHISQYGSRHTDAIVTEDHVAAERFIAAVDTACCFHNASTRFSDGYRFGLGAEVGISTDKLHARGPVGVEGLLSYRWVLRGDGQASTDYGDGKRQYLHEDVS